MRLLLAAALLCAIAFCAGVIVLKDNAHWRTGDRRHASPGAFKGAFAALVGSLVFFGMCICASLPAHSQTRDDRYFTAWGGMGQDVVKAVRAQRAKRQHRPHIRQRHGEISLARGFRREIGQAVTQVIGGRPRGCPHAFCGCGASLHLFGRIIPSLNLAANWLRFPRAVPAPKMVAARRGHVFVLERHIAGNVWLVHDSNSGRGRTRIHARSIAGYQIVNPHGAS